MNEINNQLDGIFMKRNKKRNKKQTTTKGSNLLLLAILYSMKFVDANNLRQHLFDQCTADRPKKGKKKEEII